MCYASHFAMVCWFKLAHKGSKGTALNYTREGSKPCRSLPPALASFFAVVKSGWLISTSWNAEERYLYGQKDDVLNLSNTPDRNLKLYAFSKHTLSGRQCHHNLADHGGKSHTPQMKMARDGFCAFESCIVSAVRPAHPAVSSSIG